MKINLRIDWSDLIAAVLLYAVVIVYQGYLYGQGDQSQILPCLWAQNHAGAYARDHYVQYYLHSGFNERTIFHFLFRFLGYSIPFIVWFWHAVFSITLILAWIRIGSFLIKSKGLQWLCVGLILVVGFHTSTGSNEIYYNSFIPSLAAKAIGSWALVWWLTDRFTKWSLLLIVATLLQPLVGLQLFLLTLIAFALDLLVRKKLKVFPWRPVLYYLLVIIPFYIFLILNNGSEGDARGFFDIIRFRLSHHFFASSFGWIHLIAGAVFAIIALNMARERLRWFIVLILVGCLIYELGVEYKQVPIILYTQWWKTTIWMEAFAFIGIVMYFEKSFSNGNFMKRFPFLVPIGLLLIVSAYRFSGIRESKPDYQLPWSSTKSAEVDISLQASVMTPDNAVFIVPIEFSAFRWYSKRSEYVDYKSMLHQHAFLKEWYARIQSIYQYGLEEKDGGFDIHNFSFYLLDNPSPMSVEYWKKIGITHIISTNPLVKDLTLIAQNGQFAIYQL